MATTVATASATLLRRVRDINGVAHNDVLLDVLSDCQRIINACYGGVTSDVNLTLTPGQVWYTRTAIAADCIRPIQVAVNGRILQRVSWADLKYDDPHWLHHSATPRTWDFIGHNLLAIYPAPRMSGTATIRYITETAELTNGASFEVPDQYVAPILDLAAEVLLLRQRLFPSMVEAAEAFTHHSNPRITP